MPKAQVDIPEETNILLRRYVMETRKKNREKAIVFIVENFLKQFYKTK